jgi:cytoskeletal protein CcmA (bactofilin family)
MSERVPGQREPQASDAEPVEVTLGAGMAFEGLLVLPRRARIDGRIGGEVLAGGPVWVGPTGEVEADLEADSVVVEGRVHGNLRARHSIALGPAAVVRGDLVAPRLRVAEGARVDGRCACGDSGARPAETRAEGVPAANCDVQAS